jgi:hypothetical protein
MIGCYPFVAFRIYGAVLFWARFAGKSEPKISSKTIEYIYGSMQLDELISNVTLIIL